MKRIFINKIGFEHHAEWRNCQDYGFINEQMKCVVDGCSEGKNSEVGAKLFCHFYQKNKSVPETFKQLTKMFSNFEEIKDYLLFTILFVEEDDQHFYVTVIGDGYILKQDHHDQITYEKIDFENSPPYYAYNFVDKPYLKKYQEGVEPTIKIFSKEEYQSIGVATDGLSYLLKSEYKKEFESLLIERKEFSIKRLFNRHHSVIKDDITIVI